MLLTRIHLRSHLYGAIKTIDVSVNKAKPIVDQ